jgi:hypothetical protein
VLGGRLVGLFPAQHAADLLDHALALEPLDAGNRLIAGDGLFEPEVDVGQRGDLRQVGDAEDLVLGAEGTQPLADDAGGVTADPGVDLVPPPAPAR